MLSELSTLLPDVNKLLLLLCFTESVALVYCLNFLHRDPLTQVLNRRGFFTMAPTVTSRSCYSVVAIDLDFFKLINDNFGHDRGDEVLCALSQKIRLSVRRRLSPNAVVARFGGEEFMLLIPMNVEAAAKIAERIRRLVAMTDFGLLRKGAGGEESVVRVTVSIGVAGTQPGENVALDELLRRADVAVYEAKRLGRNRVCVWKGQTASPSRRSRLRTSDRPWVPQSSRLLRLVGRTSRTLWRLSPHRLLDPPMGVIAGNLRSAASRRGSARRLLRALRRLRSATFGRGRGRKNNKKRSK